MDVQKIARCIMRGVFGKTYPYNFPPISLEIMIPGNRIGNTPKSDQFNFAINNYFFAFPNPFSNEVSIELNSQYFSSCERNQLKVVISDLLGNKIYDTPIHELNSKIQFGRYVTPGFYFFSLYDGSKVVSVQKLIKE